MLIADAGYTIGGGTRALAGVQGNVSGYVIQNIGLGQVFKQDTGYLASDEPDSTSAD